MVARDEKQELLAQLSARLVKEASGASAEPLRALVGQLLRYTAAEDLAEASVEGLCAAMVSLWEQLATREPGKTRLRIYTPIAAEPAQQLRHTVIEVVTDDMPFLVDSVRMGLQRHGLSVHLLAHSVFAVERDAQGRLTGFATMRAAARPEAVIYIEVDRRTDVAVLDALHDDLLSTFADVRAAVADWSVMRRKLRTILDELSTNPPAPVARDLPEAKAFLEWIDDHHFTFLGYREYALAEQDGEELLRMVPGSALGTAPANESGTPSQTFAALPPSQRARLHEPQLLILTKANVRSTVHRPAYMDYIGIKRFDAQGRVIGEHRFLGLYTSAAYNRSPRDIPILRRKLQAVLARAAFPSLSHSGKALLNILETYPRDELFQISDEELYENAMRILTLEDRRQVCVFVRREIFGRFVSCLVYVPRERFDTATRERIQRILLETFHGESVDYTVYISESVLARVYFIIHTPPGGVFGYDAQALHARLLAATRTWRDELHDTLDAVYGEEIGDRLYARYADAFPAAYREEFDARAATRDIEDIEELASASPPVLVLYVPRAAHAGEYRCKIFATGTTLALSDILPLFENLGVRVLSERPYEVRPQGTQALSIYDIALQFDGMDATMLERVRTSLIETMQATWRGLAENDGFNQLALRGPLTLREIVLLRAYAKYLRQLGLPFGQSYVESVLAQHAKIAQQLVALFHARFSATAAAHTAVQASRLAAQLQEAIDAVASLDADRLLRAFFNAVQATVRTNFARDGKTGEAVDPLVLKIDPRQLPECPAPRPAHEIFVYSPRVEGVHLRGGAIARGGIRWSDRREDFRTEVLGLMKAQMVKNAIIVPVGAKGGFVVKQPPAGADRAALAQEVSACYGIFIRGLLAVTDNMEGDRVVGPPGAPRYDGDDPYLVVAADKGTATFSDQANAIAAEAGFWLADAFASGGSSGYDHKRMGITARGAWESVRRHFHELGLDVQHKPFTVVGIGDMSGDVFGNGMLQARTIKLIGAFDHRHVFIDPIPDPEASYRERERLFRLPRSSWADYDPRLISPGGGVYPRSLKSISLSPQARQVLGVDAEALTPDGVIRALLKAPVDLLWNGGIGTYVKAGSERHTDVGDRGNDAVRIDARELRCRVVGEGGNLGVTQRGRIEYALAGGRIHTDFIDNAGGVACSDYEVNIKILLNELVRRGVLDAASRQTVLMQMTDEVAALVLAENRWQALAISLMATRAPELLDEHAWFIGYLERRGRVNRALEQLPTDEELAQRRATGAALTRPELAVLLAYAKIEVSEELAAARLSEIPAMQPILVRYFPASLRARAAKAIRVHPLRHELIATYLSNRMVNRLGASFVFRVQEELGMSPVAIARAYLVAWQVFELPSLISELDTRQTSIAPQALRESLLIVTNLMQRAIVWLLRHAGGELDVLASVADYRPAVNYFAQQFATLSSPAQVVESDQQTETLAGAGMPPELAKRIVRLPMFFLALDVSEVRRATDARVERAVSVYLAIAQTLDLDWLHERIAGLPARDHWQRQARTALEDDLYAQQRAFATVLLQDGRQEVDAATLVEAGFAGRRGALERYRDMIAQLRKASVVDLSMLTVAVQNLRDLYRESQPTAE